VKEAREAIIAQKDWRDLMSEKVGRDQAQIIERDGPGVDGEGLSAPRPLRRHDGGRFQVAELDRRQYPGPAIFPRTTTKTFTSMALDGALRPRVCAYCRPYESLQHDVRSLLHDANAGWLRA